MAPDNRIARPLSSQGKGLACALQGLCSVLAASRHVTHTGDPEHHLGLNSGSGFICIPDLLELPYLRADTKPQVHCLYSG